MKKAARTRRDDTLYDSIAKSQVFGSERKDSK